MTKLLELMATRIGESLGGDGDGIGLVLGRISECVDMVLPPLSMEMEEGVGLDVPGRRMKELINTYSDEDDGPMNLMTSGKWANLVSVSLLRRSYARVYEERGVCVCVVGYIYIYTG